MSLFVSFIVALSILNIAFGTFPDGYSFDFQSNAELPPPVNYTFTSPVDGNPFVVLAGTGDARTTDGDSPTITAPQFI